KSARWIFFFFFQAEDGIRDFHVTGVQTCALPIYEEGPAVIGLAWSDDLVHWERTAPILIPEDGAAWESGGLYKPYMCEEDDLYRSEERRVGKEGRYRRSPYQEKQKVGCEGPASEG